MSTINLESMRDLSLEERNTALTVWLNNLADVYEKCAAERDQLRNENERLRSEAQTAVNGFRRWKRNQGRKGDRHEAEHGLEDLGQGVSDLDELLSGVAAGPAGREQNTKETTQL